MIKFSKKDKIILIAYIIITIMFFVLYLIFHNEDTGNIITETEIKEINETKELETETKYYLSIIPGEYFDTLSKKTILRVEFNKGIYIFEIRANIGEEDYSVYRFSGKYDKKINGVHYNDMIQIDVKDKSYVNIDDIDELKIISEGGEGILINDGGKLYWNDMKLGKKLNSEYNAIFEMPRAVKDN